ncbi:alpha/beta hydrolase [Segetibacter sp. 3557_3]|uniref:alpha/beta fold hydrolase n=1 Tax=Segetibacter sp. 3557_3 TaxID=2547429 RepID=UPI00105856EF|nr:alpha/beta hydrolase [Segetibacter sp. 3557_3]TDH20045.1 alpha/beta hydrolase [Segetibacter sp. 3557_3]
MRKADMVRLTVVALFLFFVVDIPAQKVEYPYPVQQFQLTLEGRPVQMAYMDIAPSKPNGQSILLLHGKNFNGYYWRTVIPFLAEAGYRVIVPDQVGWGRSSKPNLHYSFHMLANNTRLLLDSIGVKNCTVVGHSMGGMLATRFSLMFPSMVKQLVLENPIGLEDYKTFVPYKTISESYAGEKSASYESYKKYQQSYYPQWKPEYEQYVQAQAEALGTPEFDSAAWVNALTYQMIYEQPVAYEFRRLKLPVLLIMGQEDRTVVGKNLLSEQEKKVRGNYPKLGKQLKAQIPAAKLIEIPGVGHIPHIQTPDIFMQHLFTFLNRP